MRKLRVGPHLLAFCCVVACDVGPTRPGASGLELRAGPHLLIDDYLLERTSGVQRVVGAPLRDPRQGEPVITGVEDRNYQPYFSILRENGLFRAWYDVPTDENAQSDRSHLGYLESSDGINWLRPHRVLPDPPGGIRFGASVVARPEGGYALGYNDSGGLKVATSSTGFEWTLVQPKELIKHTHDISGLTYDPIRRRYIGIVSVMRNIPTGGVATETLRMTQQSVSYDLLNWEEPWDIVIPDARDDEGTQFYAMDGFLARGDVMIAMVKVLRDDLDADGPRAGEEPRGLGYTTLAWSRDGRTWTRDRTPFLSGDPTAGRWDHAMAWIDEQVPVRDSVYLYYAGYQTGHKGDKTRERQIGLVRIARDRYAGWEDRSGEGFIETRLLSGRFSRLTLNAAAAGGAVVVRALDAKGRDLLGECEPISGDGLGLPLRCERDVSTLDEPFRLRMTLRNARVYAFETAE